MDEDTVVSGTEYEHPHVMCYHLDDLFLEVSVSELEVVQLFGRVPVDFQDMHDALLVQRYHNAPFGGCQFGDPRPMLGELSKP